MDITQAVLLTVIIVLTIFLLIIGFQAFFVLKDLRKTLVKMNKLFEDTDSIIERVQKPVESASHFFTAIAAAGLAGLLKKGHRQDTNHERSQPRPQ